MCGVIGVVTREAGRADSFRKEVEQVLDCLSFRGPDAMGIWEDANVLLGHRRLSIIDLSDRGTQPLHDTDNGLHISFNGEIYNFRELRREIESRGYRLQTDTDTEVIMGAYNCYGERFAEKLRGMFAFIIYDERRRQIILCRDRIGKKPLYYSIDGNRLIVASELKAFYAFRDLNLSVDMESLRSFFYLQYIPGPWTILNEVRRVEPGQCLFLDIPTWRISSRRYWSLYEPCTNAGKNEYTKEELVQLISESIRYRLIADVEIGVMLSGGVDSSLLSCYASELSEVPLKAFVVSFDQKELDESLYAKKVASALGMELVEVEGRSFEASVFERVVYHADEPLGDPACVPTFMISESIGRHLKVVISGEGADELFWGYPHYRREILLRKLTSTGVCFPRALALKAMLTRAETDPRIPGPLSRLCKLLESNTDIGVSRWTSVFGEITSAALFSEGSIRSGSPARFVTQMNMALNACGDTYGLLEASIATDLSFFLPDDLLVKVDRMTMAHSIEARTPFLDHKLVEYALRMPADEKADLLHTKKTLRKLLVSKLPADIAESIAFRRKHGFDVPLHRWLRSELREVAETCFSDSALREVGFLNINFIKRLWCGFINHGGPLSYARKIWVLLCFLSWHRLHAGKFDF